MKKTFFICCIAVSALALGTSANTNNYHFNSCYVNSDTTPPMMSDSMHHGAMKHHKDKMMKDTTSGMTMSTDSTSTAPPQK